MSFGSTTFSTITRFGVLLGLIALVGQSLFLAVFVYWQNRQRLDIVSLFSVLGNVLFLVLTVASIKFLSDQQLGAVWAAMFVTSGTLLTAVLSWATVIKKVGLKFRYNPQLFWRLLRRAWPLGLTLIFNLLYFRADTLILTAYLGNTAVGVYGLAYKFFEFALTVLAIFMNSLYPMMIDRQTSHIFNAFFKKSVALIFGTGIILAALTFAGANYLFLVKSEYAAATPILQILSLFIPTFFLTSPLMWFLILHKRQKLLLFIYSLTASLSIIFNVWLIPHFGIKAAALITGISEMLVLVMMLGSIKHFGLWKNKMN